MPPPPLLPVSIMPSGRQSPCPPRLGRRAYRQDIPGLRHRQRPGRWTDLLHRQESPASAYRDRGKFQIRRCDLVFSFFSSHVVWVPAYRIFRYGFDTPPWPGAILLLRGCLLLAEKMWVRSRPSRKRSRQVIKEGKLLCANMDEFILLSARKAGNTALLH